MKATKKLTTLALATFAALMIREVTASGVYLPVYAWEKTGSELHVRECLDPSSVLTPKSWTFPSSYTGHRSVCWLPGATSNMSFAVWTGGENFTPGEPYGFARNSGTNGCYYAVELARSYCFPRINLLAATSGQGQTLADYFVTISNRYVATLPTQAAREQAAKQMSWTATNRYEVVQPSSGNGELTRVRVVRWVVNGNPVYRLGFDARVVLDKMFDLAAHPTLTEADLMIDGALDLDWNYLANDEEQADIRLSAIDSVAYIIVIGDGLVQWRSESDSETVVKVVNQVIERRFNAAQATPVVYSPDSEHPIIYNACPTFSWTIPTGTQAINRTRFPIPMSYTAFRLQILPETGDTNTVAAVYDSEAQLLPPRDVNGRYIWTAPVRVGGELAASTNYRWRVTVLNAKYKEPAWSEAKSFSTAAP